MNNFELKYSQFLLDISQQVSDFVKNTYFYENIDKNNVYNEQTVQEQEIPDNNIFSNVDNSKVELVDYNNVGIENKNNKTLLYVIGAIIVWSLLRGK